ncbi:hypothetical protein M0638_19700 [Roseomonas sp. NAR14]|uniref:Uncharacterized protein n=1 Tax=Roseomonas acroporae TaxID=2937791 RepID=A0A9X1Y9G7_9PROT|nr:hypothetical protein [Roseomonas acroporae]MCK8786604.1 hypothetical protein [Roseomonas acroporae]
MVKETFQTAYEARAKSMLNRARNLMGEPGDAAADQRLRDLLTGQARPRDAAEAAKAANVRRLLDDQRAYLAKAGVELGERRGYFPRIFDAERIMADSEAFAQDAAALYRKMGLNAADARRAAEDWLDRLAGVGRGAGEYGHTPTGNFTKGRQLPPEADAMLRRWMVTDPREALRTYFDRSSRMAEYTRRFGRSGEKVEELFSAMRRQGVEPADIALLRSYFEAATGTMRSTLPGPAQVVTGWVQTIGTLSLLPRAVLSSMLEGMTVGSRTGNPLRGLEALVDTVNALRGGARTAEARRVAELLGVTTDAVNDTMAANVAGLADSRLQQRLVAGMFQRTGLHAITEAQRIAAARIGQVWVRQLADEVATGAGTTASATRLLAELGMTPEDATRLAAWLKRHDGTPPTTALLGDEPEAVAWRTATRRFVNEAVQNPEAVDKPALAGHAAGRLAYGITSFMFAFTRNVLLRSLKQAGEGLTGGGYTLADRARLLGPLVGGITLAAAQYGFAAVRDGLFSPERRERETWVNTLSNLDRTGLFGTLSPVLNAATGARYDRSLLGFVAGPYVGHLAENLAAVSTGLLPAPLGRNSDGTNSAEHRAVRGFHAAVLAPAVSAAASLLPAGRALGAVYGVGMMAGTSRGAGRALADSVAGPLRPPSRVRYDEEDDE